MLWPMKNNFNLIWTYEVYFTVFSGSDGLGENLSKQPHHSWNRICAVITPLQKTGLLWQISVRTLVTSFTNQENPNLETGTGAKYLLISCFYSEDFQLPIPTNNLIGHRNNEEPRRRKSISLLWQLSQHKKFGGLLFFSPLKAMRVCARDYLWLRVREVT